MEIFLSVKLIRMKKYENIASAFKQIVLYYINKNMFYFIAHFAFI